MAAADETNLVLLIGFVSTDSEFSYSFPLCFTQIPSFPSHYSTFLLADLILPGQDHLLAVCEVRKALCVAPAALVKDPDLVAPPKAKE